MARDCNADLHFRFPALLRQRVDRAARKKGVTISSIVREGVELRLAQIEADLDEFESRRDRRRGTAPQTPPVVGLGLSRPPEAPKLSGPPLDIARFAEFILGAEGDRDRDLRMETVASMIRATSEPAEAERTTRALDEEIRRREKAPTSSAVPSGGLLPWTIR